MTSSEAAAFLLLPILPEDIYWLGRRQTVVTSSYLAVDCAFDAVGCGTKEEAQNHRPK
jgi:hypothetical protein